MTIELISETKPAMVADADLVVDPLMRYPATGSCSFNGCSDATENYWVPLAVSKSISDVDTISTWYQDVLGASVASEDTSQDGIHLQVLLGLLEACSAPARNHRPPARPPAHASVRHVTPPPP